MSLQGQAVDVTDGIVSLSQQVTSDYKMLRIIFIAVQL